MEPPPLTARAALALLLALLLPSARGRAGRAPDPWAVPPEGACTRQPGPAGLGGGDAADAFSGVPLPGDVIHATDVERLRRWVPEEIWEHRDRFFFDGMEMEIGPCYRDYGPPAFYTGATRRFAGRATLADDGRLLGQVAGLPFPPASIDPRDSRAGLEWAWNWVSRYQGAGSFGEFRLSIVGRPGVAASWNGESFWVQLAGRADRPAEGFRQPAKTASAWVAGGVSRSLRTGNQCAFRQYATGRRRPDLFVATSGTRKLRRVSAADTEGALQACLVDASIGTGLLTHGQEPHLHDWTVRGVVDLLAPINTARGTYPARRERRFGPWGISFANDRWELRRVLVLEGALAAGRFEDGTVRFRWYLDLQTLQPLYYAADRRDGETAGVGHYVYRWSEDRPDYPRWPDDPARPVRVLDEVGVAFVEWSHQHAVRVESGARVSLPAADREINRMISLSRVRVR